MVPFCTAVFADSVTVAVISADPSIGTMLVLALRRMVDLVGEVSGTGSHDMATTAAITVKATVEVGTVSLQRRERTERWSQK